MALGPLRLAGKSVWEQARYDRRARNRLHKLRQAKQLATCVVSISELLYSSRDSAGLARFRSDLSALLYLHMTEAAERQVEELMGSLAGRGQHRTPIPDPLLTANAPTSSAVVLHYYSDGERHERPAVLRLTPQQ